MKIFKKMAFIALTILLITSCTDDETTNVSENKVDAYIQFDHIFGEDDFELNHSFDSGTSVGDVKISNLQYIITDITLHGSDGTADYTATTQESFHIVDAACSQTAYKYLTNVPDGTYDGVTFRYGVNEEIYEEGADAQGSMLETATDAGLFWGWTAGYKFLSYEGTYGTEGSIFKVHNGSHGSSTTEHDATEGDETVHVATETHAKIADTRIDNSKLITIDFSSDGVILVSDETSPKIHLAVDVKNILNSTNVIDISEGDIIIDAHKSPLVSENISTLFSVNHIHSTDSNFDLPEDEDCESSTNPNDTEEHDHNEETEHDHN